MNPASAAFWMRLRDECCTCSDIKTNNNLLINEEKENKENSERIYNNNQNQRSCITTNFTQANSKQNSNDDKINQKILDNKNKISNNKFNNIPLKVKLNFDEYNNMLEQNKNDTSNIDENDNEDDIIKPIKKSIINLNYDENRLEKSFEDRNMNTKFYMRTEVKKNKINFLQKLDFSENVYLNLNQDDNNIKNIHISSYKPHKKYFN